MSQIDEQKEKASKTLAIMLDYLGLEASLKVEEKGNKIALLVTSEDAGRIIGRKGQTLENLQLLLNRMMFKGDTEFPKIVIDIDGYSRKEKEKRGEGGREESRGGREEGRGGRSEGRGGRGEGRSENRGERSESRDSGRSESRGYERDSEDDAENEERLSQQALDAAKEVKRWGEAVTLPPLNAHDRRIIHITLQDDTELQTESTGDGAKKSVVISLKKQ